MAESGSSSPQSDKPDRSDRDLVSIAEARSLARRAKQAWLELAEFDQPRIDAIVDAMAAAATPQAEAFARLAVEETGYGVVEDKIQKNLFGSQKVYNFIKPMKTVGVVNRIDDKKIIEIGEPFGVVAAIVPSTNPTSTAIYKVLIALKARCATVVSPHPAAVRCITRAVEIMCDAACRAGAPTGSIGWMNTVTLEGTQELMKHRDVAVILATGGMGLVRAAYSAGKPAYGVGPGNAPAFIERTANLKKAVRDVVTGKTFDNGVLCSSENSVVVDEPIAEDVKRETKEALAATKDYTAQQVKDFNKKAEAKFRKLGKKLDELKAKADKQTGQAKADLDKKVTEAQKKADELKPKLNELKAATSNACFVRLASGFRPRNRYSKSILITRLFSG